MTSIKVKFRASTIKNREGSLFVQIIHNREVRQIKTDIKVFQTEWNTKTSSFKVENTTNERKTDLENGNKIIKQILQQVVSSIRYLRPLQGKP